MSKEQIAIKVRRELCSNKFCNTELPKKKYFTKVRAVTLCRNRRCDYKKNI